MRIGVRPFLKDVLELCESNLGLQYYQNWRQLADEVNDLFDTLPEENNDDSDGDYVG